MAIRNAAKGIIVHRDKVLLNQCTGPNGFSYSFPGGGQNQYETMAEAVKRECFEETGYTVIPVRFAAIHEEIFDDEAYRAKHPDYTHRIYHFYLCELEKEEPDAPTEIDSNQVGIEWVDLDELNGKHIVPEVVSARLNEIIHATHLIYTGSHHIPG